MKLSLEEIQEVLSKKVKDTQVINSILKDLEQVMQERKEELEEVKVPKRKSEFAIIMIDESREFKDFDLTHDVAERKSMTGYVVKYKEGDDAGAILSKLSDASRAFNETRKGKKSPITSITEIFAFLKPKFLKLTGAGKLVIQTKEPVRIIISNNKLV